MLLQLLEEADLDMR